MKILRKLVVTVFIGLIMLVLLIVPLYADNTDPCIRVEGLTEKICRPELDTISRIVVYHGEHEVKVLRIDPDQFSVYAFPSVVDVVTLEQRVPVTRIQTVVVQVPVTTIQQVKTEVPVTEVEVVTSEVPVTKVLTAEVEVPVTRTVILTIPVPYTVTEYVKVPETVTVERVITVPHDVLITEIVTVELRSQSASQGTAQLNPVEGEIDLDDPDWWERSWNRFWRTWWWAVLLIVLLVAAIAIAAAVRRRRRHHHP